MEDHNPVHLMLTDEESNSSNEEDVRLNSTEIDQRNYVEEAKIIVLSNEIITNQNALMINKKLQEYLILLRGKLETMLEHCQQKYARNEQLLSRSNKKSSIQEQKYRRLAFFYVGAPFFKTVDLFKCPPHADYLERKLNGEYFPFDNVRKRNRWTARDKLLLVQGVREQLIIISEINGKYPTKKSRRIRTKQLEVEVESDGKNNDKRKLSELYRPEFDKYIDWYVVSSSTLLGRHTPNCCLAMWNAYLMPTLNKSEWSQKESKQLLEAVKRYNEQDWESIAKSIPKRSVLQCIVWYQTVLSYRNYIKTEKWSKSEDKLLLKTIEELRIGTLIPWTKVVQQIPGRNKAQIYNRYMNTLKSDIDRRPFSVEEDCVLMAAIEQYGENFQLFPGNLLPGRNLLQIRNRYNNVLKNVGNAIPWTVEMDEKLMKLVAQYGPSNWLEISKHLEGRNRISCRRRYQTIKDYLLKYPGRTVANVPSKKRPKSTSVTVGNWMETIIKISQKKKQLDALTANKLNGVSQETTAPTSKVLEKGKCTKNKSTVKEIDVVEYEDVNSIETDNTLCKIDDTVEMIETYETMDVAETIDSLSADNVHTLSYYTDNAEYQITYPSDNELIEYEEVEFSDSEDDENHEKVTIEIIKCEEC